METKLPQEAYDSLEDYIQCEVLDFCGCGQPGTVLAYLLKILRAFKHVDDAHGKEDEEFKKTWNAGHRELQAIFNSIEEEYFAYYFLAREEYTEHGGSVPGWITDKGKELLELLEKWDIEENGKEINS